MTALTITNGLALIDGALIPTNIFVSRGIIVNTGVQDAQVIDATGLLILPGIVDIHGDAFERQIQPRPGINFPFDLAVADTERQLLANGITTAFHGVTLSWEPGLRGIETWRALLNALDAHDSTCDMRVHLRWEVFNLDALDTALGACPAKVNLLIVRSDILRARSNAMCLQRCSVQLQDVVYRTDHRPFASDVVEAT